MESNLLDQSLSHIVSAMSAVLFFDIAGFPFIVLWLIFAGIFFTVYLRGVNFRLFKHGLDVARGKYNTKKEAGEISPLQALLSALSATVGLGSIAGISVGVAIGGPGAVFWMVCAGFLGMATKFAEVTLSMYYRKVDADGKVFGGPFQYIHDGFSDIGKAGFGKALALLFAVFCLGGAIGGGNMFQSNQVVKIFTQTFQPLASFGWLLSLAFAVLVFVVLIGSIKRIAKVAEAVVPMKGFLYLICAIIIIIANSAELPRALHAIFTDAFTAHAATGGFIGMLAIAFKRASFANEAGLGSAPIAHSTAQTEEPVREGAVALLEPFFAALLALLTGIIVTITSAYQGASANDGVMIASHAFSTVSSWFPALLAVNVLLFAYSTTIGWSYYGEIAWSYLFGRRGIRLYYILFCSATFLGGILNFGIVLDFSDLLILGMAFPNLIAVYALRKRVKTEMESYISRYM